MYGYADETLSEIKYLGTSLVPLYWHKVFYYQGKHNNIFDLQNSVGLIRTILYPLVNYQKKKIEAC